MSEDICVRYRRYLELRRDRERRYLIDDAPWEEVHDTLSTNLEEGLKMLARLISEIDDPELHVELAVGPIEDFFSSRTKAFEAIAPYMNNAKPLMNALQHTYMSE